MVGEKVGSGQIRGQTRAADRFGEALVNFDGGVDLADLEVVGGQLLPRHRHIGRRDLGCGLKGLPALVVPPAPGKEIPEVIPRVPVVRTQSGGHSQRPFRLFQISHPLVTPAQLPVHPVRPRMFGQHCLNLANSRIVTAGRPINAG